MQGLTAIVSFPRAGNHLVRYIIEHTTKGLTLGEPSGKDEDGRITDQPLAFKDTLQGALSHVQRDMAVGQKVHFVHVIRAIYDAALSVTGVAPQPYDRALYIQRHPVENYLAYYQGYTIPQAGVDGEDVAQCKAIFEWLLDPSEPTEKEREYFAPTIEHHLGKLAENLVQFYTVLPIRDQGSRMLFFYEDLVGEDKILHVNNILGLMGIHPEPARYFLETINERYKESLGAPDRKPTSGTDFNFYRKKFVKNKEKENILESAAYNAFKQFPAVTEKYFKHLKEKNNE